MALLQRIGQARPGAEYTGVGTVVARDRMLRELSLRLRNEFISGTDSLLDAMTEAEVEAAIANDPDWAEFNDIDWSDAVLVIPAKKKAISIRVDEDVLDYFKSQGDGYQRRINAVLRSYMQQKAKPKKRA